MIKDKKIILSMATMPCRKDRLIENLPSIYSQSCDFDILILNVNNNVTSEDMNWYYELTHTYDKMIVNKCEDKWKSCNKLLPTLEMYPDDIIITIDDDVFYPKDCIKELIIQYKKTSDCIIAHEINPLKITNNKINYINGYDIKLKQKEWGKYLTGCALFPPHVFDNTDLYDYDKMLYCTEGTHDELWFWVNSTLNGVQCIGLNYVKSFQMDIKTPWRKDEYRLSNIISNKSTINSYMEKINELYGSRLLEIINNKKVLFTLDCNNIATFLHEVPYVKQLYNYGFNLDINELTKEWKHLLNDVLNKNVHFYY